MYYKVYWRQLKDHRSKAKAAMYHSESQPTNQQLFDNMIEFEAVSDASAYEYCLTAIMPADSRTLNGRSYLPSCRANKQTGNLKQPVVIDARKVNNSAWLETLHECLSPMVRQGLLIKDMERYRLPKEYVTQK
jgi:hypothetical protein